MAPWRPDEGRAMASVSRVLAAVARPDWASRFPPGAPSPSPAMRSGEGVVFATMPRVRPPSQAPPKDPDRNLSAAIICTLLYCGEFHGQRLSRVPRLAEQGQTGRIPTPARVWPLCREGAPARVRSSSTNP